MLTSVHDKRLVAGKGMMRCAESTNRLDLSSRHHSPDHRCVCWHARLSMLLAIRFMSPVERLHTIVRLAGAAPTSTWVRSRIIFRHFVCSTLQFVSIIDDEEQLVNEMSTDRVMGRKVLARK